MPSAGQIFLRRAKRFDSWAGGSGCGCIRSAENAVALRPDQTLGGKGIAAGPWQDTDYVAYFEQSASALPLHPVLAAQWFRAAAGAIPSIGSGGAI